MGLERSAARPPVPARDQFNRFYFRRGVPASRDRYNTNVVTIHSAGVPTGILIAIDHEVACLLIAGAVYFHSAHQPQ